MNTIFRILFLLFFCQLKGQGKRIEAVYFEFDRANLYQHQIKTLINFTKNADTSKIESIQIYGYCDDRGGNDYNYKLSEKRVATVLKILLSNGIAQKKIFICEGKGPVNLDIDTVKDLEKIRYKNRRVDLVFTKTKAYHYFPAIPKVGDLIILDRILFEMGSSILSLEAKKELDRTIVSLTKQKSLRFEIKGHVCCTLSKYPDAIDKETQNRNLSVNRAKNVFIYLKSKGISPYRMSYKGYGNQFPLGKGDALDRRVEFLIVKI